MIAGATRLGLAMIVWLGLAANASAQQFEDDHTQQAFSAGGA